MPMTLLQWLKNMVYHLEKGQKVFLEKHICPSPKGTILTGCLLLHESNIIPKSIEKDREKLQGFYYSVALQALKISDMSTGCPSRSLPFLKKTEHSCLNSICSRVVCVFAGQYAFPKAKIWCHVLREGFQKFRSNPPLLL